MTNGLSNFQPPKDPKAKPVGSSNTKFGCLGCLGIIVVLFVGCSIAAGINAAQPKDYNTAYQAESQCEARVKEKLKAPSTAEFSGTTATGGGPWTVTGQVDSQNSFGAMIRSPFGCTVTITGESARVRVEYIGD
jgi:hypothetical protein